MRTDLTFRTRNEICRDGVRGAFSPPTDRHHPHVQSDPTPSGLALGSDFSGGLGVPGCCGPRLHGSRSNGGHHLAGNAARLANQDAAALDCDQALLQSTMDCLMANAGQATDTRYLARKCMADTGLQAAN